MDFSRITGYLSQIELPDCSSASATLRSYWDRFYSQLPESATCRAKVSSYWTWFSSKLPDYATCRSTVSHYGQKVYSLLPDRATCRSTASYYGLQFYIKSSALTAFIFRTIHQVYSFTGPIIWTHKWKIIGSLAAFKLGRMGIEYYKSLPQYPIVKLKSCFNVAQLSMRTIKSEVTPPNATLVFCVDKSTSMTEEGREAAVKKGISDVLDSALRVTEALAGTRIEIAIDGFTTAASEICAPTVITSSSLEQIKGKLEGYHSNGGTTIRNGLERAISTLEGIAETNPEGVHTLILLTDGEDNLGPEDVRSFHERLAAIRARHFAIGIGGTHRKNTLQQFAANGGEYIDTSIGEISIENAIAKIYEQAVATFRELVLSTTSLAAGTWSVDGVYSTAGDGVSECNLGFFTEEHNVEKRIQIHSDRVGPPLELANVSFTLHFTDPAGRKGTLPISWGANTVMDPAILHV